MIDVDTVRRNFNIGHYDPNYMLPTNPLSAGMAGPHLDHRVLVHWNQTNAGIQQPVSAALKSDEEEDDDDEDRPFTPPPPRERLSYTRYQLELLNGIFLEVRYPNSTQKQLIAKRVGITRDQVKIWFQNRRRKEVIGNSGKAKSSDTSMSSSCSSGISESHSPAADDNAISSSDENNCFKDSNETVVPSLVMKSIIGELIKFTNDPLKGKKNRKKSRAKQKEREKNNKLKKGLATTLLHGAYDMISPPNQVTPTAFFEKMKNGFNHSKNSSAFASPRDNLAKPAQISNISSTSDTQVEQVHSAVLDSSSSRTLPVTSVRGGGYDRLLPQIPTSLMNAGYPLPAYTQYTTSLPNDFPVLTDILAYKTSIDSHMRAQKDQQHPPSQLPPPTHQIASLQRRPDADKNFPSNPINVFSPGRPLSGFYPYPFLAEQPMMLSSMRQMEHIFRPAPQYPSPNFSDDPYQPLFISSISNPFYSPPSGAWSHVPTPQSQTSYTQL